MRAPGQFWTVFACCLLLASAKSAAAQSRIDLQQSISRIDLDAANEESPAGQLFGSFGLGGIRVAFPEADAKCPQEHWTLRASAGVMRLSKAIVPHDSPVVSWRGEHKAIDDQTFIRRLATPDCAIEMLVRQQVRQDETWIPLLVARTQRPSLTPEERRDALPQAVKDVLAEVERRKAMSPEERRTLQEAEKSRQPSNPKVGPYGVVGLSVVGEGFAFEGAPQRCIDAVGEMLLDANGVSFLFPVHLPGELNRFIIERTADNENRAFFHFVHDDCRFEIVVGKSILRDGRWVALPPSPNP